MGRNTVCLGMVLVAALTLGAQASISSSFDADAEGWVVADVPGVGEYVTVLNTLPTDWHAAGGHPGGYISAADPSNNTYTFQAPAAYLGDKSAYVGGSLNFSLQTTDGNWDLDRVVVLVGTNGMSLVAPIAVPTPLNTWVEYSLPLQAASFLHNGMGGSAVSDADFSSVMNDLAALRISAEFATPVIETTSLDSVVMVPEPATLGLVLLGMIAVRRRPRRTCAR